MRLQRTRFGHVNASGALVLLPFLLLLLLPVRKGPFSRMDALPMPFLVLFGLLFGAGVLAVIAWMVFGEEQWELRPGVLRIRKRIFGREWVKQYADAELFIRKVYYRGRTGTNHSWELIASVYGRHCNLASGGWMSLAEIQSLASYISAVTGWPFRNSTDEGRFTMLGL